MKIIQLTAENVKKLKVVDITPKSDFIQVTGPNGSGKTSVLDSIWWALGGKDDIQSAPIRKGTDKARIRLDLGSIVVERKFTASGTTITVKNAEGASYPSPQRMLDDLIGRLSFDPLAFAKKDARQQYEELKSLANVQVDIEALELANKTDFAARTDVNRRAKEFRARSSGFQFMREAPKGLIDITALVRFLSEAERHNAEVDKRAERRAEAVAAIARGKSEIEIATESSAGQFAALQAELEAKIAKLRLEHTKKIDEIGHIISEEQARIATLETKISSAEALPEKIDTAAIEVKISDAGIVNKEFEKRTEQAGITKQAESAEAEAERLTKAMSERDAAKLAALQSADMPVDGLSLASGQVLFNGVPFDQASDAEQLRVSVAIAMAANPKLRVIRIRDGSLLDENGIQLVAELAKEKDYQVWMERVDNSGKIGIVMEDGSVASDNQGKLL